MSLFIDAISILLWVSCVQASVNMLCCLKEEMLGSWIQVLSWKQEEVGPESGRAWRLISLRQFFLPNRLVFHFWDLFLSMCTNKAGVWTGSGEPHTGKRGAGFHTMSSICEGWCSVGIGELPADHLSTSFSFPLCNSLGSLTPAYALASLQSSHPPPRHWTCALHLPNMDTSHLLIALPMTLPLF